MHLVDEMKRQLEAEESMFRAQLLREDIGRLQNLGAMARRHETLESFAKEGLYIGWTQGDLRTHELREPIAALLAAIYAYETGGRSDQQDRSVRAAWQVFDRERMEKLLGCL